MSAPRTSDEELRAKLARRERSRASKARRNRIKHHPCPTCETSGHIRRSFGFAYPGDLQSEAWTIEVCRTCNGDGALPPGREPFPLRAGERAATWWEISPPEFDVQDLDLDAVATEVGIEVDALVRELEDIRVGEDPRE